MDDDDDLRINTLHRFAKHSPRLILHEYSHCEVPAGCGGVVLRWIDPADGRPVITRVLGDATSTVWLDGKPTTSSLGMLRTGMRVIAVAVMPEKPCAFVVSLAHDADQQRDVIHLGAPVWRCTATSPPAGWERPDFDDTSWAEPTLASAERIAREDNWQRTQFERARERGQQVFATTGPLWLRVAFTMTEPA
ncbi:MAG: hypothetical protein ABI867_19285 [Kofleriaceae bacterium]